MFVSATNTTFINFCEDYRTCPFYEVIFEDNKASFSQVGQYEGKVITVSGQINTYEGRSQIILSDDSQVEVE